MVTKKATTKKSNSKATASRASKAAAKCTTTCRGCKKPSGSCVCKKANAEYDKSFRAVCLAIIMAGLLAVNGAIMVGITIGNNTNAATNTVHYEGPIFDEDEEEGTAPIDVAPEE